ncbi:hypothetical protein [Rhodanobacter sp. DHG33]|uniref:hypothetical protein n=1 Tax=Rhodanobacter sp. DHG33 TaxID=2775921 RepID=UPI00178285F6|nr:hypothetical protein [Rhodanobacter sp. DHG33]MBD8897998.1 hypothetical protein [Rhodanobacter sp. DHG33]
MLALSACVAGAFGAPSMTMAADDATGAPAAASSAPSDTDLASAACAIGEEQFLPGDYYYCLATQSYGLHHYAQAQKFFTTAAGWASKPAQYVLGIMALDGDHQPRNRPLAAAWLALASERPQSNYASASATLAASLTSAERQAADQLLARMRPTYGDATAAVRAEKRYEQGMARLASLTGPGGHYCMEGLTTPADVSMANNPEQCPPVQVMTRAIDQAAAKVFDGWTGHVNVGPLQPVNASPAAHGPR